MDRFLFWLGLLSGILLSWLFGKLRPFLSDFLNSAKSSIQQARDSLQTGIEAHYLLDLQNYAQRLHLAASLFPLDKVLIEPLLLAPPPPFEPSGEAPPSEITSKTLPYLPDWPELVRNYGADTLTLEEALGAGANLLLIGRPGSGKTVALAHMATQLARRKASENNPAERLPILVHACDLQIANPIQDDPIVVIGRAVSLWVSRFTLGRVPDLFHQAFQDGRVLLLLDGMDDLSVPEQQKFEEFLGRLLREYPSISMVTSTIPEFIGGLMNLGFVPVPMATWNEYQRLEFLSKWDKLWQELVSSQEQTSKQAVDPLIIKSWLVEERLALSPLEFTLKYWAAFAGDSLGSSLFDSLQAHLRRMAAGIPGALKVLEILAVKTLTTQTSSFTTTEAHTWITTGDQPNRFFPPDGATNESGAPSEESLNIKGINVSRVLSDLVGRGLLVERLDSRFSFSHPLIAAYLTASKFEHARDLSTITDQPEWAGRNLTLELLSAFGGLSTLSSQYLQQTDDPLLRGPLHLARWIRHAPSKDPTKTQVLRFLADLITSEGLPLNLRARLITYFVISEEPGSGAFLRQLLSANNPEVRYLAALGCGSLCDLLSIDQLSLLLKDQSPLVSHAACLALVAIGDTPALEAVAGELLHGNDDMRRIAAEALANHPQEGHPVLQEGSVVKDFLVRRAVIFGLQRVKEPWAQEILRKMQDQDGQWVVRTAATQALAEATRPDPRIPKPPQPLSEVPWLISFAAEHGIGISPHQQSMELLLRVFEEGSRDQQLAALDICRYRGNETIIANIYRVYLKSHGELREAALDTLWYLCATGLHLPLRNQYN